MYRKKPTRVCRLFSFFLPGRRAGLGALEAAPDAAVGALPVETRLRDAVRDCRNEVIQVDSFTREEYRNLH